MKKLFLIFLVFMVIFSTNIGNVIAKKSIQIQQFESHSEFICSNKFEIKAKYSYIRSYPGGGGIFIIYIIPGDGFSGYVSLKINSDPDLNIEADKKILNKDSQVAEITINPIETAELKTYEIKITASYHGKTKQMSFIDLINKMRFPILSRFINLLLNHFNINYYEKFLLDTKTIILEVEMFDWTSDNLPNATIKRDEFVDWLEEKHPEFGTFKDKIFFAYLTYPAHLVVEHWSFLYDYWEMRICFHVTIPPYNWSQISLRKRGEIEAIFAAKRESDGAVYEIPIEDYPIFYGY
jgi:hypothetical protein